jgi:hypothetical protein
MAPQGLVAAGFVCRRRPVATRSCPAVVEPAVRLASDAWPCVLDQRARRALLGRRANDTVRRYISRSRMCPGDNVKIAVLRGGYLREDIFNLTLLNCSAPRGLRAKASTG